MNIERILNDTINRYQGNPDIFHETGFPDIDATFDTPGVEPGTFISLLGRPKSGKTFFMLNWIDRLIKMNRPVYFFSMEMGERETFKRLLRLISGYNMVQIIEYMQGNNTPYLNEFRDISRRLDSNLCIDGRRGLYVSDIAKAILEAKNLGYEWFFLDHHYEIKGPEGDEYKRITNIITGLVDIVKVNEIRFVLAAQCNRTRETSGDGSTIPTMGSAKGTSAVEEKSDTIIGIANPSIDPTCSDSRKGTIEACVLANRMGTQSGKLIYYYSPKTGELNEDKYKVCDSIPKVELGKMWKK